MPIERDFMVRVWRKEHGLPDDRVLSLLSDSKGFLWIGTRKGVTRFDGRNFMTWSRSTHAAFVSEECFALAEDREGGIWVGTGDGVVCLGHSLVHHPLSSVTFSNEPLARYEPKVTDLLVTPENELLVATTAGLVRRSPTGQWRRQWPEHDVLFALAQTPNGVVWVGFAGRQFPSSNPTPITAPTHSEPIDPETSCTHRLVVSLDGTLWGIVGKWPGSGHLYRLNPAGWQRVSDELIRSRADPRFLFADNAGGLWHSRTSGALVRREGEQRTVYQLPASLSQPTPLCMAQDLEGNLWLGMVRDGLMCLQPRAVQAITTGEGLKDNNVWTLLEATDGGLWVGTDSGVTRFERTPGGGFTGITNLDFKDVRALAEDREGRIWIGTRSGLHIRAGPNQAQVHFPGEWFNSKIRALHTSRDGAVWVATAVGLYRLHQGQTNSWRFPEQLPHDDVRVILEDHAGFIWVGTDGGGLARLTENGFEQFDESKGLSSMRVWALHEDSLACFGLGRIAV